MHKMLRITCLAVCLSLTAPVLPAWAAEPAAGVFFVGKDKVYIDPAKFDSTRYMSPPPTGLEAEEDMRSVERWQERRSASMAARTVVDSEQSVFVLGDMLGVVQPPYESSQEVLGQALGGMVSASQVDRSRLSNQTGAGIQLRSEAVALAPVNIYQLDGIVRRAPSLQETADAREGAST